MKHKPILIALSMALVISISLNIYQYQSINTLKSQYTTLQSSIDDLQTEKQSLDSAVSDKDAEIDTLTATIDDLQSQIEALQDNIAFMESIEPISVTMYTLEDCDTYSGPNATDFDKIGSLSYGDEVTVIGKVTTYKDRSVLWYELENGSYVSGAYLADTIPVQQQTSTASSTSQQSSSSSSSSGGTTTVDNSIPGMVDIGTISFGGQATAEGGSGTVLNFQ